MKQFSLKHALLVTAAAAGIGLATPAGAVVTQTITASLTSVGALDVLHVADMNFGSWFLTSTGGANNIVLVKATTGAVTPTANGTATATEVVANTTPAELTVAITGGGNSEDGTVVQMQRSAIVQFADTDIVLSAITYRTATEVGENALAVTTNEDVTIVDGATPEPVYYGGTITVEGAVNSGSNTATFDATFSY